MQFDATRLYRVKAVAEALDVSPATIYRAVETGRLAGYKIGEGKGAIRIPGSAIPAYLEGCARTATVQADVVADGRACVVCGADFVRTGVSHGPAGHSEAGSQVFACLGRCEQRVAEHGSAEGVL